MWPTKRVPIGTRIRNMIVAVLGPTAPPPVIEPVVPAHQQATDLIQDVFDAHALPKRGDRIFIVLDQVTGALTSKMGIFEGFGTLPDGGTDGEVRVGSRRINLSRTIWLACPDTAMALPHDIFASVVGMVREELALTTREDYDLPWGMHWN